MQFFMESILSVLNLDLTLKQSVLVCKVSLDLEKHHSYHFLLIRATNDVYSRSKETLHTSVGYFKVKSKFKTLKIDIHKTPWC